MLWNPQMLFPYTGLIITILIQFGLENVMHAGLICNSNGEHDGKIVKKTRLKIDGRQSEYSMLWS